MAIREVPHDPDDEMEHVCTRCRRMLWLLPQWHELAPHHCQCGGRYLRVETDRHGNLLMSGEEE